jgi:hypothetical protein
LEKEKLLSQKLEAMWWVFTVVVIAGVLAPIYYVVPSWPFLGWNLLYIVTLITLARYIFLLEYTVIAKRQRLKIALLLLMFPFTFALIHGLNIFMSYIGEKSWEGITGQLLPLQKKSIESYMWGEMLFFAVGSILVAPLFAGRMFMSVWRLHNRGTV